MVEPERNRYRSGQRELHSTDHEWLWVTDLILPTAFVLLALAVLRWPRAKHA